MSKTADPFTQLEEMADLVKAQQFDLFGGAKPAAPAKTGHGGEGSRGGHVIGHTKSGKPIYAEHGHEAHASFTADDHADASMAHHHIVGSAPKSEREKHEVEREKHRRSWIEKKDADASAAVKNANADLLSRDAFATGARANKRGVNPGYHKLAADLHDRAAAAHGDTDQGRVHRKAAIEHRTEAAGLEHAEKEGIKPVRPKEPKVDKVREKAVKKQKATAEARAKAEALSRDAHRASQVADLADSTHGGNSSAHATAERLHNGAIEAFNALGLKDRASDHREFAGRHGALAAKLGEENKRFQEEQARKLAEKEKAKGGFAPKLEAAKTAGRAYSDAHDKARGAGMDREITPGEHEKLADLASKTVEHAQAALDHIAKDGGASGEQHGALLALRSNAERSAKNHQQSAKETRDRAAALKAYKGKEHAPSKMKKFPDYGGIRQSPSFLTNGHIIVHKEAAHDTMRAQVDAQAVEMDDKTVSHALRSFVPGNERMLKFTKTDRKDVNGNPIYKGPGGVTHVVAKEYAVHDTMYGHHEIDERGRRQSHPLGDAPVAPSFAAMPMTLSEGTAAHLHAQLAAHASTPEHEAHVTSLHAASAGMDAGTKAQFAKAAALHDEASKKLRAAGQTELAAKHESAFLSLNHAAINGKKYLSRDTVQAAHKAAIEAAKPHVESVRPKIQKSMSAGALMDDLVKTLHNEGALPSMEKSTMKTDTLQPNRGTGKKAKAKKGKRSKMANDPGAVPEAPVTHLAPMAVQGALTKSTPSFDVWVAAHVGDPDRYRHRPRLNRPRPAADVFVGGLPDKVDNGPKPLEKSEAEALATQAVDIALRKSFAEAVAMANAGTPAGEALLKSVMPGRMPAWTEEQRKMLAPKDPDTRAVVRSAATLLKSLADVDTDARAGLASIGVSEASLMQRLVELKLSADTVVLG